MQNYYMYALSYILSVVVVIVAISYFLLLFSEGFITLFFAKFCIIILHVRVTDNVHVI